MAAFNELDWSRFDVWAAIAMEGIAVVETAHREACHEWLRNHDYGVTSIDFAQGIGPALVALEEHLHWKDQFGYELTPVKRIWMHCETDLSSTFGRGKGTFSNCSVSR